MKLLITLIFLLSLSFAQTLVYKVKAPLFGSVGKIVVNYSNSGSSYDITASMNTYGFAKKLSGNRVEHYHAYGTVVGGKYHAKAFIQDVKYKNKQKHLEYLFNYSTKTITKVRHNLKNGKVTTNYRKPLNYWTYNDLFSIYHNIVHDLKGKKPGWYKVKVAGLEKHGGTLMIKIPSPAKQKEEAEDMGVKNVWIFHIITNKAIMKSKNGEIIFAVGEDGIAKAVRVLDIPFVSHLDGVLVR